MAEVNVFRILIYKYFVFLWRSLIVSVAFLIVYLNLDLLFLYLIFKHAGYKMNKCVGAIEEFEFLPLSHGKHLHLTIAVTGWLCSGKYSKYAFCCLTTTTYTDKVRTIWINH